MLAVDPTPVVNLSGGVGESTVAVLLSFLVISVVLRPIGPCELSLAVELAIQPLSLVYAVIGILRSPFSFGQKGLKVQVALILPSVLVLDPRLHGRVIAEDDCVRFAVILRVVDCELACGWLGVAVDCSFVVV